jgi:hypothetical protein
MKIRELPCAARGADETSTQLFIADMPYTEHGFLLRRVRGRLCTNVPWVVVQHSPSGFSWGYGGSGPADLALNTVENVLRGRLSYDRRIKAFRGTMYALAWLLHQDFKREVIAGLDSSQEHTLPYADVLRWVHFALEQRAPDAVAHDALLFQLKRTLHNTSRALEDALRSITPENDMEGFLARLYDPDSDLYAPYLEVDLAEQDFVRCGSCGTWGFLWEQCRKEVAGQR